MKLHKEGYKIIFVTFIVLALLSIGIWIIIPWRILQMLFFTVFFVEFIWTISFFRVPKREININENHILSSADGKIVAVEEVIETEFFKDKRIMISVFMSPFNIHVNWYPFNGKVIYSKYHKGKFFIAYQPKSSIDNERNSIVLEKEPGTAVLIRQIAGMMARRIISYAKPGDIVKQGEEFGIIKFGSRVDFFLPANAKVYVTIGQKVVAQKTVIAHFR
ncbi:MAG: phosphatidylserine decarboxylase family protein [Bacteroidetes bacterium]|nr:phosphatidylserine decarboxylase family protein [Bacteroidota bacterium]MBL6944804.1 phosphatidylserine decarboxylase family protein [Bacteroidales bacterium]